MDFKIVITQIIVLFIIIFTGYFIRKIDLLDDYTSKKISGLVIYVTAPMLVLNAMIKEVDLHYTKVFQLIGISVGIYTFLFILTIIVPKILKIQKGNIGIYKFMIFFSNVAFVGFPVLKAVFGDEAIFYAAILNLPFYFLIYTLGVYFVSIDKETIHKFELKKLVSPAVIAVIIGLIVFSFKIKLPMFILNSVDMLGSATTPLSMLIIGSSLVAADFKKVFMNHKLIVLAVLKLFIIPIILYLVLKLFGFDGLMLGVPVIIVGMPVASNAVIVSKAYGGNDVVASEGIFISTLLSLISIPFLALLLSL